MLSGLQRALGIVSVEESATTITIKGIPADVLSKAIARLWQTNRINANMFSSLGSSFMSFPRFFAVEVDYMLEQVAEDAQNYSFYLRTQVDKIRAQLREKTWLRQTYQEPTPVLDLSLLSKMARKPLPHHPEFLKAYNDIVPRYGLEGYLLAADPGTGKTYAGLALATCAKADVVIVISPKKAVYRVWESTIHEEFGKDTKIWIADRGDKLTAEYKYHVAHYETLNQALAIPDLHPGKRVVIVVDECHNFNEIKSLRTQLLVELCQRNHTVAKLWMSGTPVKALGTEVIPLLRAIDPLFTADVEERFRKIFAASQARALEILAHRMGLVTHKVAKAAVTDVKPITIPVKVKVPNAERFTLPVIRQEMAQYITERLRFLMANMREYERQYTHCLDLHRERLHTPAQREAFAKYLEYIRMIKGYYDPVTMKVQASYCNHYELKVIIPSLPGEWKKIFAKVRSTIKYVYLQVQGEALGNVLGKRRAQCAAAVAEAADIVPIIKNAAKKTVIFSNYVSTVLALDERLRREGFQPLQVYGATNDRLPEIVAEFEKNPDANPLEATFPSLSEAVPLVMANTVIMCDHPFREHIFNQAVSRVARLGQDTQTYVYVLTLDTGEVPNISTRSEEIMAWSAEQIRIIMGQETQIDAKAMAEAMAANDNTTVNNTMRMLRRAWKL